jgi:hypothetical protein
MGRNVKSKATGDGVVPLKRDGVIVNQFMMLIGWLSGVKASLRSPTKTPDSKKGAKLAPEVASIIASPVFAGQGAIVNDGLHVQLMPVAVTSAVLPFMSKVPTIAADKVVEVAMGRLNTINSLAALNVRFICLSSRELLNHSPNIRLKLEEIA